MFYFNHFYTTILFMCSTYTLCILYLDGISMTLQLLLFVFLQYKYYMMTVVPEPRYQHVQHCVSCNKMTPQSYIHCLHCKKCLPVTFDHYSVEDMCVQKDVYKRYLFVKRFFIMQQIIILSIMSFLYPICTIMVLFYMYITYHSFRYDLIKSRV